MKKRLLKKFMAGMLLSALVCQNMPVYAQEDVELGEAVENSTYAVSAIDEEDASVYGLRSVAKPTQEEIRAYYFANRFITFHSDIPKGVSIVQPYAPGTLSDDSLNNALNAVNFVRYVAGIPDNVEIDEEYNYLAQCAALVNAVNDVLTHYPEQPEGMSDELYNAGLEGASSSNIGLGFGSVVSSIINGYMWDEDLGNIDRVGHRRWLLYPPMQYIGFGLVNSKYRSVYTATYAHDNFGAKIPYQYVAWPANNMPLELLDWRYPSKYPWSVNLGDGYEKPDISSVEVKLTQIDSGKTWTFNQETSDYYGNYFNVNNQNYGMSKCIVFRPNPEEISYEKGMQFEVEVKGIKDVYGEDTVLTYTVDFFNIFIPITEIALDYGSVIMNIGDSEALHTTILPENTTDDKTLTWESSDENIVSVENGVLTAQSAGTANIVVRSTNGKTASCTVVVKPEAVEELKAVSTGKNKVTLTWTASSGAEGYLVYAQKDGKYGYVGMTTKGTSYTDTKALDSDYNFYWVFPYVEDDAGKMHPGGCTKYVYAKGVCPAVTNLKASSVSGGVKLTWTVAAGAEGYLVYGIENGGQYGYVGMTSGTTFTAKKASKDVYNFYWIFPYHKNAEGKMITGGVAPYTYGRAR